MKITRLALALVFSVALTAAEPAVTQARKMIAEKKFDDAIATLDKVGNKSPEVKAAMADALLGKADGLMYNDALPPQQKYPSALRTYRQVLIWDKDNKKAQANINTIEGIYKSMGRPIPQ